MNASINLTNDLLSDMELEQVFQKHVIDDKSYFFSQVLSSANQEYQLRYEIAVAVNVNINDVIIVGSAKLGFSVKTEKFLAFDSKFNSSKIIRDKSDIDIAIVNRKFFDEQAKAIFELSSHFDENWIKRKWRRNIFYNGNTDNATLEKDLFRNYTRYLAKGWLRPDYTPNLYLDNVPWKVVDTWRKRLDRKISIGIYSDWFYLKHYHMDNFLKLRIRIRNMEN